MLMKFNGKLKRPSNIFQGKGRVSAVRLNFDENSVLYGIFDACFWYQVLGILHVFDWLDLDFL